jgi:hypothetical protein
LRLRRHVCRVQLRDDVCAARAGRPARCPRRRLVVGRASFISHAPPAFLLNASAADASCVLLTAAALVAQALGRRAHAAQHAAAAAARGALAGELLRRA